MFCFLFPLLPPHFHKKYIAEAISKRRFTLMKIYVYLSCINSGATQPHDEVFFKLCNLQKCTLQLFCLISHGGKRQTLQLLNKSL